MTTTIGISTLARRQRGAAMVEFVVIAIFLLVPMFLAVQALGKFADVRSATQNAARYVAWERTVWSDDTTSIHAANNAPNQKSSTAILNEVRARLMNGRETVGTFKYKDTDRNATTYINGTDPFWKDTAGDAYNPTATDLTATLVEETPAKDFLGKIESLFAKISIPGVTGTFIPPVPVNNMAVATVHLNKVAATSDVYKRLWAKSEGLPTDWIGLDFTAPGAVLSNTWAANSSVGTKKMVEESVPTSKGLGKALQIGAMAELALWDPLQDTRLELGKVAVDVVPADRLK